MFEHIDTLMNLSYINHNGISSLSFRATSSKVNRGMVLVSHRELYYAFGQ